MLRIKEVKIENYKNISRAEIDFSDFNVITGPNNSGKSNFLQIFPLLDFIINGHQDLVEDSFKTGIFPAPFKIISKKILQRVESKTSISIIFSDSEKSLNYYYNLDIDWRASKDKRNFYQQGEILREKFQVKNFHKTGKPTTIFDRNGQTLFLNSHYRKISNIKKVSKYSSVFRLLKIIDIDKTNNTFSEAINALDSVIKSPIYYFSNTELSKQHSEDVLHIYNGKTIAIDIDEEAAKLEQTNKWLLFKEILNAILNITDVEILKLNGALEKRQKSYCVVNHLNERKYFKELSDGSLLVIALITKILTDENTIFFIEEVENSLHPKALEGLINFFKSYEDEKQFILTSHSVPVINMVQPENVIVTTTNKHHESQLSNIKQLKELRKQLKNSYLEFSDYIFFNEDQFDEEISVY